VRSEELGEVRRIIESGSSCALGNRDVGVGEKALGLKNDTVIDELFRRATSRIEGCAAEGPFGIAETVGIPGDPT
jgi:hypothetical protein